MRADEIGTAAPPPRLSQRAALITAQRSQERLLPIKKETETILGRTELKVRPEFIYSKELNEVQLSLTGSVLLPEAETFVKVLNEIEKATNYTFNFKDEIVEDATGFKIRISPRLAEYQVSRKSSGGGKMY